MKYLLTILVLLPLFSFAQREVVDSVTVVTNTGQIIRFTQPTWYATAEAGDSIFVRNATTKKRALISQLSLPVSTATQTALNLKANTSAIPTTTSQLTNNSGFLTAVTKSDVGLSNVDNTSDANKPVSTATQTALNLKANTSAIPTNTNQLTNGSGFLTSLTGTTAIGYTTGAGGTVTQATSKTTPVTLNKLSGQIVMNGAALTAASEVAFTLTNSFIASTDVVIVNVQSVGTAGAYLVGVGAVANGSCSITVSNASAGSLSQALVLNFAVIKSANN